jgi:drug/metabolite transporter (DMT)-like permease
MTAVRRRDATWLVALAASLWGTSAVLRTPLAQEYPAATLVVGEHLVIVLVTLPWLPRALRAFRAADAPTRLAVLLIGAGASALATLLFTQAFRYGDPVTPQVLQKLQPLVAVLVAWLVLRERVTRRYPLFLVPALAGAWLLAFPDPLDVTVSAAVPALLAVGAAALWGAGTVLGRFAGAQIGFRDLTVLRFAVGLPTALVVALLTGVPLAVRGGDVPAVVVLALVPGLLALGLYYRGLRRTPASRATLAELAFPFTAALVGVGLLGATLAPSQWLGLVVVAAAVTALALHERVARQPAVAVPARVEEAVTSR